MSIGNLKDQGNKGNNFPYQLAVLKLLDQINASINNLPGIDYETRTTIYQAIASGIGYSIGDIIVRYDIIDVATSTVVSTLWFNQTTQATISAPNPLDIVPYIQPSTSRTPTITRVTNSVGSPIPSGRKSITVANTGNANGLVMGAVIKPGESLTWSAGMNDTLTAISYDGTGTELLITTVL